MKEHRNVGYNHYIDAMEPFSNCSDIGKVIDDVNFLAGGNRPVVIKLMHDHLRQFTFGDLDRFKSILKNKNFFVITLSRKNVKDQILSWYIAQISNQFINQSDDMIVGDYKSFTNIFQFMLDNIQQHTSNVFDIPIHQKLFYEDIIKSQEIVICDDLLSLEDKGNVVSVNGKDIELFKSLPKHKKLKNLKEVNRWYSDLIQNKT